MISIHPNWPALIGLLATVVFGFGVGFFVRRTRDAFPLVDQRFVIDHNWKTISKVSMPGSQVGFVERLIFFAALWSPGAWPLLTSWLVFKLALYWQGANFFALPEKPPNDEELEYIVARRLHGTRYVATALVGTGANIIVALAGVALGRWIKL